MRSLLSILLIGVPVTLILCLVGLSHGFLEDSQRRTRGIGADVIVRPPGSTLLTLSGARSPRRSWTGWRQQPHVKLAVGVVNQPVQGITLGATGIDLKQFDRMSGGFTYLHGGPVSRSGRRHHRPVLRGPATRACGGPDQHPEHPMARLRHHRRRQAGPHRVSAGRAAGEDQQHRQGQPDLSQARRPGQHRRRGSGPEGEVCRITRSTPWRSSRPCTT